MRLASEDADRFDGFLAQVLAVLHKHPHDSFDLDGAVERLSFIAVRLERQFLLPPWELFVPNVGSISDGISHVLHD